MSEPLIDIADALVAALNGHGFSLPFAAERKYVERKDIVSSPELTATVMMNATESEDGSRGDDNETHALTIAIHKKVGNTLNATVDPLLELVREIHDFCRGRELAGATVVKRQMIPRYDLEALAKLRVFLAFVTVECLLEYTPPEDSP